MMDQSTDQAAPKPKARIGRPPKTLFADKRRPANIRLREPIREKLLAASAASGLSMSEEIERRVDASFDVLDALGAMIANLARVGEALSGRSWREDRATRDLVFGLVLARLEAMRDDPESALLADEARRAREHWLTHAWRGPLVNDPFVGAPHLRPQPGEAPAPAPTQASVPAPTREPEAVA